jgi:site-specific DNA recombinase
LTTVQAILSNVKYTGRQVWNRRPAHHTPAHVPGPFKTQRWASTDQWVFSERLAHPALVSEADFVATQRVTALPGPRGGGRRRYQLVGLLRCGWCGRRLESSWSHGRPAYRCQQGHSSAQPRGPVGLQNVYVREDSIIRTLLPNDDLLEITRQPGWQIARQLRQLRLIVACTEAECRLETDFPD